MHPKRDELLDLFQLDGKNKDTLKQIAVLARPLLPQVLEKFYERATANPEMSAFLKDPEVMAHARSAQQAHWEECLTAEFSDVYFESAKRIGRIHPKIGLPFSFFLSSHSYATSLLQKMILERYASGRFKRRVKKLPEKLAVLSRMFALDSHLILEAHFEVEQDEQQRALEHLTAGIDRLADQNLTTPIPSPSESNFPERYVQLSKTYNRALNSLSSVVSSIHEACQGLNSGTIEVSQSSGELAQRTESQAATLEETAAAVEEITTSMRGVSEATHQASSSVQTAQHKAEEGRQIVRYAVEKMKEISQSSEQISKIISVIDDISFQTNLLALNAGVEAARAGESGRGFAVVASEVRALALRTATSAYEIKELIDVSSGHVESGVRFVSVAGDTLQEIVENIQVVRDLTAEVVNATDQQTTAFSEINVGVSQLDNVTQQNAAMVEETAAALMDLRNNTGTLSDLVSGFKLARKGHESSIRSTAA
ncbi:methyl-accepting chemotaxis protein [Tritonibacter scottomollicae]|uniref:methyl-accepting chemotaxis protein n=1 Tax=Tritonibacter scottomollicae TaxID=483013 RepID=UPI003BABF58B